MIFAAAVEEGGAAELLFTFGGRVGCPPLLLLALNLGDCIDVSTNGGAFVLLGAATDEPTALEVVADEVAAFLKVAEDAPSDGSPLIVPAMVE